jgi:methanol metabolism-related c-type cytochrome
MKLSIAGAFALGALMSLSATAALAEKPADPKAVKSENGKYLDVKGDPTFNKKEDGTVDWYTFSGFRRYHAECHVCHGPAGIGSTYAPALKDSVKIMDYAEFFGIVVGGRSSKVAGNDSVMPAFADNKNAMCYINDIYVYLRARSTDAVPPGRPEKREDKPAGYGEEETKCMSGK